MGRDPTLTVERVLGQEQLKLPGVRVRVRGPNGKSSQARLKLKPFQIGTGSDCDLVVSDARISHAHCQLSLTAEGVILKDLGSKNGTHLGGARIFEALLPVGAAVTLGGSVLEIFGDEADSIVPLFNAGSFGEAVGASLPMRALFAQLDKAAPADAPIVLLGESGTGKELLAHAVHGRSPRAENPFVVFDCSAVAPALIEDELFGHAAGAFTGAVQSRVGLFEQADQGTLFLDEIGELPLDLQPRLLRALETQQVKPLGSNAWRRVDVRIIAATHRELRTQVATGKFREDLLYRLAVVEARVPPLRERREDIPLLVAHFLKVHSPPRALSDLPPGALELLQSHHWPGNLRELRNVVSRLVLFPEVHAAIAVSPAVAQPGAARRTLREAREEALAEFEERYLRETLGALRGNVTAAAESLGISRQFAHKLLARYGVRSGNDG